MAEGVEQNRIFSGITDVLFLNLIGEFISVCMVIILHYLCHIYAPCGEEAGL